MLTTNWHKSEKQARKFENEMENLKMEVKTEMRKSDNIRKASIMQMNAGKVFNRPRGSIFAPPVSSSSAPV